MALETTVTYGQANRATPSSAATDGLNVQTRVSRRGELVTQDLDARTLVDQGAYYVLRNATPGTGIAGHAAPTTVDDTKALLFLRNAYSVAEDKRVYLDYLKLQVTAAGTNATDIRLALKLDKGTTRYSSGATAITPVSPNFDVSTTPTVTAYFGAVTCSAASSDVRVLGGQLLRTVIPVVGDTYIVNFGPRSHLASSHIVAGTAIANIVWNAPPVVLPPTATMLLHQQSTSQSGAHSFEFECGFWVL